MEIFLWFTGTDRIKLKGTTNNEHKQQQANLPSGETVLTSRFLK